MKRLYAATRPAPDHERCELCAVSIDDRHEHLFAPAARELRCVCQACGVIVPTAGKFRRIPRDRTRIDVTDIDHWLAELGVPVGVAAVIRRDDGTAQVSYPGPAGLAVAAIDDAVWSALCARVPAAADLAPEVEALVWTRLGTAEVWRVGIDVVFRLVGELRASWEGLTGGPEAPRAIARVLDELRSAA